MRVTGDNLSLFTKSALAARKVAAGLSPNQAAEYVGDAYEMTQSDVRDLKKQVAHWRRIYEDRYRNVRHFVFAHKRKQKTIEEALARTNIIEIKEMLGFLSGLHLALDQLFLNGRKPVIHIRPFAVPPKNGSMSPGERVYAEGHVVLRMVAPPDPDELQY